MSAETFHECFASYGWTQLQTWLASRELPFLFERSARVSTDGVETRRGLLSLPLSVLRQQRVPPDEVLQICRSMSSPDSHLASIARFLPSTGCVHFGFEAAGDVRIGKCYLERPSSAADQLVFLGFKWSMTASGLAVVSRYHARAISDQPQLKSDLLQHLPADIHAVATTLLEACVPVDTPPAQLAELRLLEVTEEGSNRRSLDLNLYEQQHTLARVAAPTQQLATAISSEERRLSDWLTQNADAVLGHLSLGTDRTGHPFLTLYHAADVHDTARC